MRALPVEVSVIAGTSLAGSMVARKTSWSFDWASRPIELRNRNALQAKNLFMEPPSPGRAKVKHTPGRRLKDPCSCRSYHLLRREFKSQNGFGRDRLAILRGRRGCPHAGRGHSAVDKTGVFNGAVDRSHADHPALGIDFDTDLDIDATLPRGVARPKRHDAPERRGVDPRDGVQHLRGRLRRALLGRRCRG